MIKSKEELFNESIKEITSWKDKRSRLRMFLSQQQKYYFRKKPVTRVELGVYKGMPETIKNCYLSFGECDVNENFSLHLPEDCSFQKDYYVIGHFLGSGYSGLLAYKKDGGEEKIYVLNKNGEAPKLLSDDLELIFMALSCGGLS